MTVDTSTGSPVPYGALALTSEEVLLFAACRSLPVPSGIPPELTELTDVDQGSGRFEVAARALVTRGVTPEAVEGFVGIPENEAMLLVACEPQARVVCAVGRLGAITIREVNLAGDKAVGHSWNRMGLHALYAMPLDSVAAEIASATMLSPGEDPEPAGEPVTITLDRDVLLATLTRGAVTGATLAAAQELGRDSSSAPAPPADDEPARGADEESIRGGDATAAEPVVREALERAGADTSFAPLLASALAGLTRSGLVRVVRLNGEESESKTFSWLDAIEAGTWRLDGAELDLASSEVSPGEGGTTVSLTRVAPSSLLREIDEAWSEVAAILATAGAATVAK